MVCLDDPEFTVRDDAVMAMGTIHEQPERVIPTLIQFIKKYRTDRILCRDAIESLSTFGLQARPAQSVLLELLDSDEASIRFAATNALRQINAKTGAEVETR
jgi:HEAT repeat protein